MVIRQFILFNSLRISFITKYLYSTWPWIRRDILLLLLMIWGWIYPTVTYCFLLLNCCCKLILWYFTWKSWKRCNIWLIFLLKLPIKVYYLFLLVWDNVMQFLMLNLNHRFIFFTNLSFFTYFIFLFIFLYFYLNLLIYILFLLEAKGLLIIPSSYLLYHHFSF